MLMSKKSFWKVISKKIKKNAVREREKMKICNTCGSTTFDDMEMCFDCMSSFVEHSSLNEDCDQSAARLKVVLANFFSYELLLQKLEGRSLSVGSGESNAIVIPRNEVAEHQLEVFYAHGQVWVEAIDTSCEVYVSTHPLVGKTSIEPGGEIILGDASITVLEV